MKRRITAIFWLFPALAALLSVGCGLSTNSPQAAALSATELFDLRSKCSTLGDHLLTLNPVEPPFAHEQISRYDVTDGNCYVKIFVHKRDLDTVKWDDYASSTLYNGHTREVLAYVRTQGKQSQAYIKDDPENTSPTAAIVYMNSKMDQR